MEPSPPAQPDPPPPAPPPPPATAPAAVIIIGFGLPGRFVAEILDARKVPYCVIELNPTNARSIAACRKPVVCGDARDPALLKQAGIETADLLAVTLPDERIVLEVLQVARSLNPKLRMMARCNYTSTGIKAEKAGAFAVVVEEQIVALEFAKLLSNNL
jgi:voltage-gated potassium channel Kch